MPLYYSQGIRKVCPLAANALQTISSSPVERQSRVSHELCADYDLGQEQFISDLCVIGRDRQSRAVEPIQAY